MGDLVGLDDGLGRHFQMSKLFVARSAGESMHEFTSYSPDLGCREQTWPAVARHFGLPEHEISVVASYTVMERIPKSTMVPSVIA